MGIIFGRNVTGSMGIKDIRKLIRNDRLSNYAITFGVEFLIMLITIALFKIVNIKFHTIGFSEYTINKRLVGFLIPLLMMGMGVSLPKFLPIADTKMRMEIHYSGLIILSSLFLLTLFLFVSMSSFFSKIVFGDYDHEKMCIASLIYVYSLMIHACLYNYFRGIFKFKLSNLLQLINLGLLPLIVCFFVNTIFQYLLYLSGLSLVVLIIANLTYIRFIKLSIDSFRNSCKKLMQYGIQRVPGDAVLGSFFAIPTFIASNFFSITLAGNVAFYLSLFNIIIAIMSPVNIILLPETSMIIHKKNFLFLKSISNKLLSLSMGIGILALGVIYFFGKNILGLFNISDYLETSDYLIIIFSGVIGYSVFSVIRSIIDAYFKTARVSAIIVISFACFILFIFITKWMNIFSIQNMLISFSISMNILGLLTYFSLMNIYKTIRK